MGYKRFRKQNIGHSWTASVGLKSLPDKSIVDKIMTWSHKRGNAGIIFNCHSLKISNNVNVMFYGNVRQFPSDGRCDLLETTCTFCLRSPPWLSQMSQIACSIILQLQLTLFLVLDRPLCTLSPLPWLWTWTSRNLSHRVISGFNSSESSVLNKSNRSETSSCQVDVSSTLLLKYASSPFGQWAKGWLWLRSTCFLWNKNP